MRESDEIIQNGLMQQMRDHPRLDTSHIHLEVANGHVHLKGRADTEEEKALAEELSRNFPGVISVKNDLTVELGFIHAITSIVSGIAAANEEELHPRPEDKEKDKDKKEEDPG